jgi:Mrp family chromosome partitioning ATPase
LRSATGIEGAYLSFSFPSLFFLGARLKSTDWGDLDVLILDLPPGTGDIQLGVLQDIQMTGAVAVTTPSKLAIVDTQKGMEMFSSLGVPTLAIVENMSYFEVSLPFIYSF